ncbi:hypothetical protein V8G54_033746 [Vigna mungo]|uniref:Beta-catenin-like protein 1 N-terminal domain-containing protein n=1 Tax=Vigna mungo TaxID=3915 RepID=A0AAQ3MPM2_VIGMU
MEERLVSLIASLFGKQASELLCEFRLWMSCLLVNNNSRLYSDRVRAETERLNQVEFDDLEMDEDEIYNRKLESGLYTLQLIAVILGHIWCSEHPQMRGRIELLLKQNKLSKKHIKDILQEYHDNIGDLDGPEEKERAQTKIQKFIMAL